MAAEIEITEDRLVINITGADRVWGLRRTIDEPLASVMRVHVEQTADIRSDISFRLAGVGVPHGPMMGYMRGRSTPTQWWLLKRAKELLVIDYDANARFQRVVLQVDDPTAEARRIDAALSPAST